LERRRPAAEGLAAEAAATGPAADQLVKFAIADGADLIVTGG
jgi:hypothetical protein